MLLDKFFSYSAAAATLRRAHFTPLCFSINGIAGSEAACFIKRFATGLSSGCLGLEDGAGIGNLT